MKNYKFKINETPYSADVQEIDEKTATVELNGVSYSVEIELPEAEAPVARPVARPAAAPKAAAAAPKAAAGGAGHALKSPLPGVILNIFVKEGETVKAGSHILMLEAMKMENNIDADRDGVVKEIRVKCNDSVMEGDVLVIIG